MVTGYISNSTMCCATCSKWRGEREITAFSNDVGYNSLNPNGICEISGCETSGCSGSCNC